MYKVATQGKHKINSHCHLRTVSLGCIVWCCVDDLGESGISVLCLLAIVELLPFYSDILLTHAASDKVLAQPTGHIILTLCRMLNRSRNHMYHCYRLWCLGNRIEPRTLGRTLKRRPKVRLSKVIHQGDNSQLGRIENIISLIK